MDGTTSLGPALLKSSTRCPGWIGNSNGSESFFVTRFHPLEILSDDSDYEDYVRKATEDEDDVALTVNEVDDDDLDYDKLLSNTEMIWHKFGGRIAERIQDKCDQCLDHI